MGIDINDVLLKEVGAGDKPMFCKDIKIGNTTLKASFLEMYKLEQHKYCKVSNQLQPGGPIWEWKAVVTSLE